MHSEYARAELGQQIGPQEGDDGADEEVGHGDDRDGVQPRPLCLTEPGGPADGAGMLQRRTHGDDQPPQEGQRQHSLGGEVVNAEADLGEGPGECAGAFRRRAGLAVQLLDHGVDASCLGAFTPYGLGQGLRQVLHDRQGAGCVEPPQLVQRQLCDWPVAQVVRQATRRAGQTHGGPVARQPQSRTAVRPILDLKISYVHAHPLPELGLIAHGEARGRGKRAETRIVQCTANRVPASPDDQRR